MKICSKCKITKSCTEFRKGRNQCRECLSIYNIEYRANNKKKIKDSSNLYRTKNKDRISLYYKIYIKSISKNREEYNRNRRKNNIKYRNKHRESVRAYQRDYKRKLRQLDTLYNMKHRVNNLIGRIVRESTRNKSILEKYIGCSLDSLRNYLGPVLENYELDHICPFSQAKTKEEVYKLQHYTNLRWINKEANQRKHNCRTIEGEFLCLQLLGRAWID